MADDYTVRSNRSRDPYRRAEEAADTRPSTYGSADPLAELARLIGQPDPFTDDARHRAPGVAADVSGTDRRAGGDWRQHIQRPSYYDSHEASAQVAEHRHDDPRYGDPPYDDPRYSDSGHAEQGYSDPYGRTSHARALSDPVHDPYRMGASREDYASADSHAVAHHPDAYGRTSAFAGAPDTMAMHRHGEYAADHSRGPVGSRGDEGYDDPPRRGRSSSGFMTAVVLIGCAMLGTVGAYAYRTYSTPAGARQAPVIIADNSPSKIVPPSEQRAARSQDRIGGQGDERLVSREEQPVALQPPGTSGVPRVVFPSPVQPAPTTTGATPSATGANAQSTGSEPKRVRTVTIRPDGGDSSSQPSADSPSRAAPPSARTAAPPPAARTSRDQPLSLDPATASAANDPRAPQRSTAPASREAPAAAPRLAAVPPSGSAVAPTGGNGGFLVQVSSQRSEADAQASFRGLQAKYAPLRSREAIIRRADLGAKGIYYRALVGPFDSASEADLFCSSLKQAGGQCIILRN